MATNSGEANGEASNIPHPFPKQHQVNQLEVPQLNMPQLRGQVRQFSPNLGIENGSKRAGIPPYHPQVPIGFPFSQVPLSRPANHLVGQQNFSSTSSHVPSHTRSLSQPTFFSMDSLPPLSPSPYKSDQFSANVFADEKDGSSRPFLPTTPFTRSNSSRVGESLPPRKTHRRSSSDIPFGFSSAIQSSPPVMPLRSPGALDRSVSAREVSAKPAQLVLKEAENNGEGTGKRKTERDVSDDLVSTYMNLDNIGFLNSSEEKLGVEYPEDSKGSGSKTNGCDTSDNEATSGSVNGIGSSVPESGVYSSVVKREGLKRNAFGDIASTTRHHRSVSMDSFMGKMNYCEEIPSALPSPGATPGQLSPASSIDAHSDAFSLEFGNGELSSGDLQKIMANEKLAEIAMTDPKRAKRILANRQSAARSKERRVRYIAELEHKVLTLQTEATTMSAQVTMLQRDMGGLNAQNHELKIRLHSLEQQAQLRDALNEALAAELQRLRIRSPELNGDFQQLSINSHSFQTDSMNSQHSQQQSSGDTTANQ